MAGLYAADGSINISVVTGATWTGLYAADGSWNVVKHTTQNGPYDPCGALCVTKQTTDQKSLNAADGSLNVSVSPYKYGTLKVTVVAGSFGGGGAGAGSWVYPEIFI